MKELFRVAIFALLLMLILPGCAIHIPPYGMDWESSTIYVTLEVEPDDAVVLLNGKLIGEAYEFSEPKTAIKLASRNNEIVIKKEGYVEEAIDLYDYSTRHIKIRMDLRLDKDFTPPAKTVRKPRPPAPPVKQKPEAKPKPAKTAKEPAYTPKPAPERKMPVQAEESPKFSVKTVPVALTVMPEESSIYLNGKFWGISPKDGKIKNLRLKPGKYLVEVLKPGYTSFKKEVLIAMVKDGPFNLTVNLEKVK